MRVGHRTTRATRIIRTHTPRTHESIDVLITIPFHEELADFIEHARVGVGVFAQERTKEGRDLPELLDVHELLALHVRCARTISHASKSKRACACAVVRACATVRMREEAMVRVTHDEPRAF